MVKIIPGYAYHCYKRNVKDRLQEIEKEGWTNHGVFSQYRDEDNNDQLLKICSNIFKKEMATEILYDKLWYDYCIDSNEHYIFIKK